MKNTSINHILVTGITGVIGSQLLYELVKMKNNGQITGKVLLVARKSKDLTARQRINRLFDESLLPEDLCSNSIGKATRDFVVIESDISDVENIKRQIPDSVSSFKVVHLASSVNLSSSASAHAEIEQNNYRATVDLIEGLANYCEKFSFISTAFSSGHREGLIDNDFFKLKERTTATLTKPSKPEQSLK